MWGGGPFILTKLVAFGRGLGCGCFSKCRSGKMGPDKDGDVKLLWYVASFR